MFDQTLAQVLLEDTYSRKLIKKRVEEDIRDLELDGRFLAATKLVGDYLGKDYYSSKNKRIEALLDVSIGDIVKETMIAVMVSEEAQPIQSIATILSYQLPYENGLDAVKTASELIAVICYSDLFDVIPSSSSNTGSLMVKSNISLKEDTLKAIRKTKYLPPMMCSPRRVKNNMDTSHIAFQDSIILGKGNHHDKPQAIDAINIANRIKLSLNTWMVDYLEVSNKELDTPQKIEQFSALVRDSEEVYKEIMELGNEFYLTWKFDFRGRMYSQGYHVNIQSTDYKKSLIDLTRKEVITK